jgi:4-amino-4-deoxy-L-arabinose transferase-like glycosyltransferase
MQHAFMHYLKKHKTLSVVLLLTIISALFHFYNLDWGAPFYFHPDERNIAISVSQLHFPNQMNPHFFAYGSLPIYAIYFTGYAVNGLSQLATGQSHQTTTFEQAIIISRLYSALFATLLIPFLFFIGKKLKDETTGLLAAFFATASVGLIQFSHFGTFEMWLTFFSVLLFWICLSIGKSLRVLSLFLLSVTVGILVAVKISHLALLPLVILFLFGQTLVQYKKRPLFERPLRFIPRVLAFLVTAFTVYYFTNPFVFTDTKSFLDSMRYESTLALGTLPVFYTGEFYNTIPVVFQFLFVYPFLINPLMTILFLPAFAYFVYLTIKNKKIAFLLLASFFLILLLSQAFFFVKWTRYMIPTLPFMYLILAVTIATLKHSKQKLFHRPALFMSLVLINTIFALSYFITAFVQPDTRIQAAYFARQTIASNASVLSEIYDMGIVPFNESFSNITLFHFYDLDNNSPTATSDSLQQLLAEKNYIIIPSQRILKTRLFHKDNFPVGNVYYQALQNNSLGFRKIYETPCDIFCQITYLGDPVFRFEQTANVFDRPTVLIYKKD